MIQLNWNNLCLVMKSIRDDLYVDANGEAMTIDGNISRKEFEEVLRRMEPPTE